MLLRRRTTEKEERIESVEKKQEVLDIAPAKKTTRSKKVEEIKDAEGA